MAKYVFFAAFITALFLASCRRPEEPFTFEPAPVDTTETLTCEDTIALFYPGLMEHGFLSAINTCRPWMASCRTYLNDNFPDHLTILASTYYLIVELNGDTSYHYAEILSISAPRKTGRFPVASPPGYKQDTAVCAFTYLDSDVFLADNWTDPAYPEDMVEFTEIDTVNNIVRGRLDIHFVLEPPFEFTYPFPAKMHFYKGYFEVKIVE
jgi:hypothetical protein